MSKRLRKIKTPEQIAAKVAKDVGVPDIQVVRGITVTETLAENGTKLGKTVRFLYPMRVDRWLAEGGPGFEEPQRRAIDHCRTLWHRLGSCGNLVANYEGVGGGSDGSGWSQHEALAQLAEYKKDFPVYVWSVFENVCRFDMPAGTAGSHLAKHLPQQIQAAKSCVGFVASKIAEWRSF